MKVKIGYLVIYMEKTRLEAKNQNDNSFLLKGVNVMVHEEKERKVLGLHVNITAKELDQCRIRLKTRNKVETVMNADRTKPLFRYLQIPISKFNEIMLYCEA